MPEGAVNTPDRAGFRKPSGATCSAASRECSTTEDEDDNEDEDDRVGRKSSYGIRYYLDLYRANLRLATAVMMQYRFAVLIWAVWGFVGPLISLAVWAAAAQAKGGPITNQGVSFTSHDFAAYFLIYMIVSHFTMSWDMFEFSYGVRQGSLSPHLLKPVHPIHKDACYNVSFKVITAVMILPVWILLFILLKPTPPSATGLLLAIPALILAGIMRYIWNYTLALAAFWTTRIDAINQLYFTLDSFLGGRIAPIALMPGWLGALAMYAPFWAMNAFPVELALGRIPPERILMGFAQQVLWLILGVFVFRAVWSAGIKQYSAVGA
jgi:ABC-2 type transport system permease protein